MKIFSLALLLFTSIIYVEAQNNNYLTNRAPLQKNPFISLPIGSVKAQGWLLTQLELQKNGLTGESERLYANDLTNDNAWLGGNNEGWEKAPYYVKGLIALAYTLDDNGLKQKAQKYIDWVLNNQQSNGDLGPVNTSDWWPNMIVVYYLRDYYEATKDQRVIPVLTKYFNYQLNNLQNADFNEWAGARAGDNIEVIFWLYNITGDAWLLDLATNMYNKTFKWSDIRANNSFGGWQQTHIVNITQGAKLPAVYYQMSLNNADKNGFKAGHKNLSRERGRIDGMYAGTEGLTHMYTTNGTELCAVAEEMLSAEVTMKILGEAYIGDHLERITFNALPAHLSENLKQICYYQSANQAVSKYGNGRPAFGDEHGNNFCPSPFSGFPCCRFNWHMAWPMYVKHMWMANQENGLAAIAYGPSIIKAKVGNNVDITIYEETNYPFDETISMTVETPRNVTFPLQLRIPSWCKNAVIKLNGEKLDPAEAGTFYTIERTWATNDKIEVLFPAEVTTSTWSSNTAGIERGPLVYSLQIDEDWKVRSIQDNGFSEYEVLPTTDWNYALSLDRSDPKNSVKVIKKPMTDQPFGDSPIRLSMKAKVIPEWTLAANGLSANEPPASPINSSEPLETIDLVPYGSKQLRVSNFPVLGVQSNKYEAEEASTINIANIQDGSFSVSNGKFVADLDNVNSYVEFDQVFVSEEGMYKLTIAYANGMDRTGDHILTINDKNPSTVFYPETSGWGNMGLIASYIRLEKGNNKIRLSKGTSPAQLDYISIEKVNKMTYEAEDAFLNNVTTHDIETASNSQYIGEIDLNDSYVEYRNILVDRPGVYELTIAYANGLKVTGSHQITINDGDNMIVNYPITAGWGIFNEITLEVSLVKGTNKIRFSRGSSPAQLDYIKIKKNVSSDYEAENATITSGDILFSDLASQGQFVTNMVENSNIQFNNITVPISGEYQLFVYYSNESSSPISQQISINSGVSSPVSFPSTSYLGSGNFGSALTKISLQKGVNSLQLSSVTSSGLKIDYVSIRLLGDIYEAENGTIHNARPPSTSANASSGEFVGGIDNDNSYVEFPFVNVSKSDTYPLTIGFANGINQEGSHRLYINGELFQTVSYPQTSGWGQFETVTLEIPLIAGNNSIRIQKEGSPAELDFISVGNKEQIITGTQTHRDINSNENSLSLSPNPAVNSVNLRWESSKNSKATCILSSLNGHIISETKVSGNIHQLNTSNVPKGAYIIRVKTENAIFSQKLIIVR